MKRGGFFPVMIPALLILAAAGAQPAGGEGAKRFKLDNGMTVICQRDLSSSVSVLDIVIGGGQAAENPAAAGIAYLATRLAIDLPDKETAETFAVKAVKYGMAGRADSTAIHLECLTEYFEKALGMFAAILADPLFTSVRIDRLRTAMKHQRRIQLDEPREEARLAQLEARFGDTGYGRSTLGTEKSLAALRPKEIKEFYLRHFVAENMVLVAVSDLEESRLLGLLRNAFGGFRRGASPPIPGITAVSPAVQVRTIEKEVLQTHLSAAVLLPPVSRSTFILNALIENILGGGPGSKLWPLRVEKKLAYSVTATVTEMLGGGILEACLETEPSKTDEARKAMDETLLLLGEKGISADELAMAKTGLKARFLRGNEPKSARAVTLGTFEALGLGADFFEAFVREVDAISLESINAYLEKILAPAGIHWVFVGPKR